MCVRSLIFPNMLCSYVPQNGISDQIHRPAETCYSMLVEMTMTACVDPATIDPQGPTAGRGGTRLCFSMEVCSLGVSRFQRSIYALLRIFRTKLTCDKFMFNHERKTISWGSRSPSKLFRSAEYSAKNLHVTTTALRIPRRPTFYVWRKIGIPVDTLLRVAYSRHAYSKSEFFRHQLLLS